MTITKTELTIYQKMLVAPLAAVLLYTGFFLYLYTEQRASRNAIEQIRDQYIPALQSATENTVIFDTIAADLKDAVLAGERDWIDNTRRDKARIDVNFKRLEGLSGIVDGTGLSELRRTIDLYYGSAFEFSMAMLDEGARAVGRNELIAEITLHHDEAINGLENMRRQLDTDLKAIVTQINRRQDRLLWMGIGLSLTLLVLIILVTFALSMSTRRRLAEINRAMKQIAQGEPNFSRRLQRDGDDELAELVHWFNLLSGKLESNYKKIEQLSMTDKLTQLYNRGKIEEIFNAELERVRRYAHPFSVILLDLDHFKSVNDGHGHPVGDRVLQQVARLLRDNVRQSDQIGRWGGEEFVILLPNSELHQARHLAEKLRLAVAEFDFLSVGRQTASFGVAAYRSGDSEESMMKRADDCLYIAKKRGRNRVFDETDCTA